MKFILKLMLLTAIAGCIYVMIQQPDAGVIGGGAFVILILLWLFKKTNKPKARPATNNQQSSYSHSARTATHAEIMQIVNDYVGYYASNFDCNVTPSHIYVYITVEPDTSYNIRNQKMTDMCNEISSTYGVQVSIKSN